MKSLKHNSTSTKSSSLNVPSDKKLKLEAIDLLT
jgi:hypothetical protein